MKKQSLILLIISTITLLPLTAQRDGAYSLNFGYDYYRLRKTDIAVSSLDIGLVKDGYYGKDGFFGLSKNIDLSFPIFYTHEGINSGSNVFKTAFSASFSLIPVFRYHNNLISLFTGAGLKTGVTFYHFSSNAFLLENETALTMTAGIDLKSLDHLTLRIGINADLTFLLVDLLHTSADNFGIYSFSVTPYIGIALRYKDGFSWN